MDNISSTILILIATLVIHLIEEIKTGFRKQFPLGEMSVSLFVGINVIIYLFCFLTLFLSISGEGLALPLTWIFAVTMLFNGIGHIGIMVVKREYFPGGLTAPILIIVSMYLMNLLVKAPGT
jgi:hypothetical protein